MPALFQIIETFNKKRVTLISKLTYPPVLRGEDPPIQPYRNVHIYTYFRTCPRGRISWPPTGITQATASRVPARCWPPTGWPLAGHQPSHRPAARLPPACCQPATTGHPTGCPAKNLLSGWQNIKNDLPSHPRNCTLVWLSFLANSTRHWTCFMT